MSSIETPTPPLQGFRLRLWPLLLIFALASLSTVAVWSWPAPEWEFVGRVVCTYLIVMLTLLATAAWYVCLSGVRWWFGLLTLPLAVALMGGLGWAFIREVRFSGDMVPTFYFVWDELPWARLRDRLEHQAGGPALVGPVEEAKTDFPAYRGRHRDGVAEGPTLARDWSAHPPKELYRQPCGGGWAAFSVAAGRAVTIEQRDADEAIVCYDAATGRELWAHRYPARFTEALGGPGPRSTPTIHDGEVYALGGTGVLTCLDLDKGDPKWSVNILDGNQNLTWAMSGSPLIHEDRVIVNAGKNGPNDRDRTLVAYDRKTGKELWASGAHRAGYSSPMLATLGGKLQVILFDGDGLGGYDLDKGDELWWYKWETNQGINVAQPLILEDDLLFITSGYGVGCAVLKVESKEGKWSVTPQWENKNLRCQFTSPVLHQGHAYGLDAGILVCVDVKSGERKWRGGRYGHGQLLRSGDVLVVTSEPGHLALVEATPEEFRELGKIKVFSSKTWNLPALADGRVYLRNDQEMASFDLRKVD